MDFSKLNTKIRADEGAFLHFRSPGTDTLIYDDGKAVGAWVRGRESKTVQAVVAQLGKQNMRSKEDRTNDVLAALVIKFEGVSRGDDPLQVTDEDLSWLIEQSSAFETQIVAFAQGLDNFLASASKP